MEASRRSVRPSRRKRRPASPRGRKITCPTSTRSVKVPPTSTPSRNVMRVSSLGTRSSRARHGGIPPERPPPAAEAQARQPSWQEDHEDHDDEPHGDQIVNDPDEAQPLADGEEQDRAQRRPPDGAEATEHGHADHERGGGRGGHGRAHELNVVRVERACEAGQPRAQAESEELVRRGVDAEALREDLVLPDGTETTARTRAMTDEEHERDARCCHDGDEEIGCAGARRPGRGQPREAAEVVDAEGPSGDGEPVLCHEPDQLGEGKRDEGQVVAAQAQGREAGTETHEGSHHRAEEHPDPRRESEVLAHGGRGVGAEGEEAGVPERDLPRVAGEEIPARGEESPNHGLGGQAQHKRMPHQHGQERGGRAARHEQGASSHRVTARPSNPCGRSRSTAIMTRKATPFCHWEGTTITTIDSATPMIRLARSAPARLPMPPRMVMAKALMVSGNPTAGYTLKSGAISAPPIPARATPRARVREKMRARWMPMACAASGFCDTARTARPCRFQRRKAKSVARRMVATTRTRTR